jgi:fructan beta-fructosidase
MDPRGAKKAGWKLFSGNDAYTEVGYDSVRNEVFVDRTHTGTTAFSKDFPARTAAPFSAPGPLTFEVLVDRDSIEVFTAGGRIAITNLIFTQPTIRISFFSEGGTPAKLLSAESWSLRSIW